MGMRIIPLRLGYLEVPRSVFHSQRYLGETVHSAMIAWLILGGEKTVLVDTGPPPKEWTEKYHRKMFRTDEEYLVPALATHGLGPGDIDLVVLTHLHWDHIYGCQDVPNVPILAQKRELQYAVAPFPRDARAYEADLGAPQIFAIHGRLQLVDGDEELFPGVRLLLTPGHTPGSQAVLVDTNKGVHAIAGDTFNEFANLESSPPWPPGIFQNLGDFYASAKKLQGMADVILPGHDTALFGRVFPE